MRARAVKRQPQRPERQSSVPQQPREVLHVPPEPWQQRLVVGAGEHEYPLTQHAGAAAPGVHTDDSARLHGGVRQVPDWHVRMPQHWELAVHACPDGRQQRPP